jgi:RNA polymerase sigma-54 factor
MQLLEEKGFHVARRTIAKYREAMGIPASSERKKLNFFKAKS